MIKTKLTNQVKEYNITDQQWAVLKNVSFYPNGTKPAMIADRLLADRPTVTGIIQRLLQKGWVVTKHNPSDKRSHLVTLTDKASSLIHEIEYVSNDVIKIAVMNIPKDEIEITISVLKNMIQNLKENNG
ncbi:MarR family winged helix-turn-helix transcriptional regulator [Bacillus cereus]|uniref:MarR family winged helix-turn-helix transcriptional regulator n=1 Tax=Bacillus cereus TaxID=1396 RepID=UPI000BF8FC8C|nr:MarR family transcriptional regulator [Bacillus cereus]PFN17574.1 transcriptional regulator [Bacillus cereus]